MSEHKVLEEEVDKFILKTTHPLVMYDELCECFIVDLKDGASCEVYGWNRFSKAIEIGDFVLKKENLDQK